MTVPRSEIQTLNPGKLITLFEIDATNIPGGGLWRFAPQGPNETGASVVWQGNTYTPLPMKAEGFEIDGSGALPRPTLTVSNIDGVMGAYVRDLNDLAGAKVTRHQVLTKFLDVCNFAAIVYLNAFLANGTGANLVFTLPVTASIIVSGLTRTDWQGTYGLSNGARTNALPYSQAFNNAAFVASNINLGLYVTDPTGGSLAFTLTATGANGYIKVASLLTVPNGSVCSSLWFKRRTGSGAVYLKRADGTWSVVTPTGAWTRIPLVSTSVGTTADWGILLATSGDAVDIAFGQCELGAIMTPNIPTGATPVTVTDYALAGNVVTLAPTTNPVALQALAPGDGSTVNFTVTTPNGSNPTVNAVWRWDWQGGSRTNQWRFSESLDDASYTAKWGASITPNNWTAPNGTLTGDSLVEDSGTTAHEVYQQATLVAGPNTFSAHGKAGGRRRVLLRENSTTGAFAAFDLITGTVVGQGYGGVGSISATATPGVWRFSMAHTSLGGVKNLAVFMLQDTGTTYSDVIYAGNGNSSVGLWGVQVEAGSVMTPYIGPTTTAPVAVYDVAPSLLYPTARTIMTLWSSNLLNWSKTGGLAIAKDATGPDGTVSAYTLTDSNAAGFEAISQGYTVANNSVAYTATIYVKKTAGGTSKTFAINLALTGGTAVNSYLRLNTDTGQNLSAGTWVITDHLDGFWKCVSTITNNSSGNTNMAWSAYPATANNGIAVDSASATGSVVISNLQVEPGSVSTTFVPTSSVAVTITDYTVSGTTITCAVAPVAGAGMQTSYTYVGGLPVGGSLAWSGSGQSNPTADPTKGYRPEIWAIEQKKADEYPVITFELSASSDAQGQHIPASPMQATICRWTVGDEAVCPYAGAAVGPCGHVCNHTLTDCKANYTVAGIPGALPARMFPGMQVLR